MLALLDPKEHAKSEFIRLIKLEIHKFKKWNRLSAIIPIPGDGTNDYFDILNSVLKEAGYNSLHLVEDTNIPLVLNAYKLKSKDKNEAARDVYLVKRLNGSLIWEIKPELPKINKPWYPAGPADPDIIDHDFGKQEKPKQLKLAFALEEENKISSEDFKKPTPDYVWWDGQKLYGRAICYDMETNVPFDNTFGDPVVISVGGRDKNGKLVSYLVEPERVVECFDYLLKSNPKADWIGYNICGFDHPCLDLRVPGFREKISEKYWWDMVYQIKPNRGRILDLWVLILLNDLANNLTGDFYKKRNKDGTPTAGGRGTPPVPEEWWLPEDGPYTLRSQVWRYLRKKILKDERRTNYGQFLGRPREMSWAFAEYSLLDAIYPIELYEYILNDTDDFKTTWAKTLEETRAINGNPFFGPLSHAVQYSGAYGLSITTNNGISVDGDAVFALSSKKRKEALQYLDVLVQAGFATKGDVEGGDHIEVDRLFQHIQEVVPTGPKNMARASWLEFYGQRPKSWEQLDAMKKMENPLVRSYFLYRFISKEATDIKNYIPRRNNRLYPSFRAILSTGRTSSNNPNLQQVKAAEEFRSLFKCAENKRIITIDYSAIEMATWAQICLSRYGFSRVAELMNNGVDTHIYTGMYFYAPERESEWLPIVLESGLQKGALIKKLAKELNVDSKDLKLARQRAKPVNFGLPGGLGWRKLQEYALRSYGVEFSDEESYEAVERHKRIFPEYIEWMKDSDNFRLNIPLRTTDNKMISRECYDACVTLTGRKRGYVPFNTWHNAQFQGLAADGIKLALLDAVRKGIRTVNMVHDEIVAEADEDVAEEHAYLLEKIMLFHMEKIITDVRVQVEVAREEDGSLPRVWSK